MAQPTRRSPALVDNPHIGKILNPSHGGRIFKTTSFIAKKPDSKMRTMQFLDFEVMSGIRKYPNETPASK